VKGQVQKRATRASSSETLRVFSPVFSVFFSPVRLFFLFLSGGAQTQNSRKERKGPGSLTTPMIARNIVFPRDQMSSLEGRGPRVRIERKGTKKTTCFVF